MVFNSNDQGGYTNSTNGLLRTIQAFPKRMNFHFGSWFDMSYYDAAMSLNSALDTYTQVSDFYYGDSVHDRFSAGVSSSNFRRVSMLT